ncbi:MAG: hypothetical protein JSV89_05130 [Spirochaetaceae bacterium]|nr:MAG: hypothetical protein JSV89_05130 [Spirochaetaceae bacterium]
MVAEKFEVLERGFFQEKGPPEYGRQDLGYSPGGAQDQFSLATGNILLENEPWAPALEIVLPPRLRFLEDSCFVLTGGGFDDVVLYRGGGGMEVDAGALPVEHARAYFAPAGSIIGFGNRVYGFRTYLCFRPQPKHRGRIVGRSRGAFHEICRWPDAEGRIRVLPGPEYACLHDPKGFLATRWQISVDVSDMGLKLHCEQQLGGQTDMISVPVNDGTIQLTPSGPIVLLRNRQTVGGYPRVLNVISSDLDLLAQYGPLQYLRFCSVTLVEAQAVARTKKEDLERLRRRFLK